MKEPFFSLIVPVYKVEKYIRKCIDSILSQSFEDFELLLVDDGSPDDCGKICDQYENKDNRIRVFHKENGGLSSARNIGLNNVRGKWVSFIDSDDWIDDNHLTNAFNAINEGVDIIIENYKYYYQTQKIVYSPKLNYQEVIMNKDEVIEYLIPSLIQKWEYMSVWRNFYRKDLIKCNNILFYSEREVYGEDYLFNLNCYLVANKIKLINSDTYNHLMQYGSLSQSSRTGMLRMLIYKFTIAKEMMNHYHGKKYDEYFQGIPSRYLAYSLFKESYGSLSAARNHLKDISETDIAKSIFIDNNKCTGKYSIIFFFARNKAYFLCAICSKLFRLLEPAYRYSQFLKAKV